MLQDFLKEYTEQKTDAVLEKAVVAYKQDKQRRDEELLAFLDEFVNSEEYEQYLIRKRNIKKRNASVQYSLRDLEVEEPPIEDKYPLTTQSWKIFMFNKCFDKYITNKNNKEVVKKQEKGIKIVKDKIEEFRKLYELTKDKVYRKKERQKDKILKEFCGAAKIDSSVLSLRSKNKIRDKVVCYQKIINSRDLKIKSNITNIVRKLTREYKRMKEVDKAKRNKPIRRKVQKEKSLETIEIDGEKVLAILEPDNETEVEEMTEEPPIEEEEEEQPKTKKKQKEDENKKDKPKKNVKIEKGEKAKKAKKEKQGTKNKKKGIELVIPPIPQSNIRKKLGPENYEKLLEVLQNFENMEDMLENQYISAEKRIYEENLYDNSNFCCEPSVVIFKNFYCGKIYKKKLKIRNTSTQIHKLKILETTFADPYDALFFKIEPLFGIQKLATQCFSQLNITFSPEKECKGIQGRIVFAAYNRTSSKCQKFFVEIQCIPSYSELKIYPLHVKFGKIPVWRAQNVNCKTIKLKNNSIKPCVAVIKKLPDPVERHFSKNRGKPDTVISDILEECLGNVFTNFGFEHYYIKVHGFKEKELNIKFKNVDYLGYYFEKYNLDIYETCADVITELRGCQELCASAETTDYFIKVSSDVFDFGVCILNSIYQLSCDIHNNSSITQTISIRFPSNMSDYIKTNVPNVYVSPFSKQTVLLKFLPRKGMLCCSYYNKALSMLEFPVHFCILSKIYPDIPPIRSTIFALLSTQKDLTILPASELKGYFSEGNTMDLGDCSIFETITARIELRNNTLAPQIYGFTNIPQCLMITPNYGFGEILPNETRVLTIHFNPDLVDVLDGSMTEGNQLENLVKFKINLETVSSLGQSKFEINYKRLRKTAELMTREIRSSENMDLIHEMEVCAYYLKIYWFSEDLGEGSSGWENYSKSALDVCNKSDTKQLCKTQLWLTGQIVTPLVEFSHQYVEFPDTSCGSYTTMQIEIRALNAERLFKNCKSQINYMASFKILGGSEEISIEPTCGTLKKGEAKKLTLIVRPNIPEDIVVNTARSLKYSEVYEQKKKEYEMKKQQFLKKGATKDKKGKAKIETEKENEGVEITVSEKDLELDYLDFYPAEMCYWRNLQPYYISTDFVCIVNYETDDITKKPDRLYLKTICKVTKPDFIANLRVQRIDFEEVVVGTRKSEPVVIQNMQYHFIKPMFSLLSPVGPFTVPFIKDVKVPPEYFLEVPIAFEPKQEGEVEEYFEISSGTTALPLILRGVGVPPNIEILPKFTVYRSQTKKNAIVQCPITIKNNNNSEIVIRVEKVFELKGMIKNTIINNETTEDKGKKQKGNAKPNKSDKGKKSKKIEIDKYSDELTENEQVSLAKYFIKKSGDFCYDTLNVEKNKISIKPSSAVVINIGFGMPDVLLSKKQDELKKLVEKEKGSQGAKKSGKSQDSKQSKKETKLKVLPEDQIYHVAKFNILLNGNFLKDLVLISAFIEG